jgi:hypothetical protein
MIVAAQDSPGRKKADFQCDGRDDQVQVQEAIDALPASGGMVELLAGTFHFGNDVEITKSNVTLRGAGKSTILKHDPTCWVPLTRDSARGSAEIVVKDASQFHVGQLIGLTNEELCPTAEHSPEAFTKISDSGGFHYYTTYLIGGELHLIQKLDGNTITLDRGLVNPMSMAAHPRAAPAWVMIKAYGKDHLDLRDFSIDCNWDHIAKVYGGADYSHHPGPEPARAEDYVSPCPKMHKKLHHGEEGLCAVYMDSAHNSRFTNLHIHDIASTAVLLIASDYVLFEGNTIRNFGLKGYVNPFGEYTQVIGNIVENSLHEDGINVYANAAGFSIVSNNIVRNCPRSCISINQSRKAVVSANHVYGDGTKDDGGVGIAVISQDATVTGNFVEHCGTAVVVDNLKDEWGDATADYPITITGNAIRDCHTGMGIRGTHHVTLTGNSVADVKGRGAVVSVGNQPDPFPRPTKGNRFIISNNQFMRGTSENSAIWLGGRNHLISGNKIKGFKRGVWLERSAEGNVVERNEFVDVPEKIVDEGINNVSENNL